MSELRPLGRVLCVDDDPQLLAGLARGLRRHFPVTTAEGGKEALTLLRKDRNFAVIVSDMRMPDMNGAEFFAEAKLLVPDAVRVLLTGQADLPAVVAAINEGRIYRFLTKPIEREAMIQAVNAAMAHHELLKSERANTREANRVSLNWVESTLAFAGPELWGKATRARTLGRAMAQALDLGDPLAVETAALLAVTGLALAPRPERAAVRTALTTLVGDGEALAGARALVEELLAEADGPPPQVATRVLRAALDVEAAPQETLCAKVDALEKAGKLEARLATVLRDLVPQLEPSDTLQVPTHELEPGMRLTRPLRDSNGVVVVPAGVTMTPLVKLRLKGKEVEAQSTIAQVGPAAGLTLATG
jgi:CheY-like chemotaxis protein